MMVHSALLIELFIALELADELVRTALREQARELEKHLTDIDKRLKALERR